MKQRIELFFLYAALLASGNIIMLADARYGIGAGLNLSGIYNNDDEYSKSYGFANFYFPVQFESFRIEPEIGLFNSAKKTKYPDLSNEKSDLFLRLGCGAFITNENNSLRKYFGIRGAYLSRSSSDYNSGGISEKEDESQSYFSISGCFGAEFTPSPIFSAGLELQLNYVTYGALNLTPEQSEEIESQYSLSTNAVIFIRLFF